LFVGDVAPPLGTQFTVQVTCGGFSDDVSLTFGDPDGTVFLTGVTVGTTCTVTEPDNPCAPPAAVISLPSFPAPIAGTIVPVTVTNDCREIGAKAVNGWNTLAEVDRPENFYCVDMKTVATADDELAVGKAKVRVLKSKFDACDKRVRNLNLGSTAEVEIDGPDPACFATGSGIVSEPGTKLLNAKASDSVVACLDGFTVSGAAQVSVGKNKDGTPPTIVNISQNGPTLT
jgi:hypothetical protein